ncbi:MAG: acyl-CoA dehydratase activase [Thermodesulfobacteriota bacterium]
MFVAGCDVGSLTAKAVIMEGERIAAQAVVRVKTDPARSAEEVLHAALTRAGISLGDLQYTVGTGYGKARIPFAGRTESEITCHARGARWKKPSARTVIDIGGQDAKAIRLDADGKVVRYIYNDKCASGTGRFLEVMAEALEVKLEEMGRIGQGATRKITISNQCVIFAETEVVSLINEGREMPDIVNGLHHAMAGRVASLARSIGVDQDVIMTGGVAKNSGLFQALSEHLGLPLLHLDGLDPQINGALGAALIAGEYAT